MRTGIRDDRGSSTIELVVIAPGLLALLGLVILGGRIEASASSVEQAAASAARSASLARDARTAQAAAENAAQLAVTGQNLTCDPLTVSTDTGGFRVTVGEPASVSVEVSCRVPLSGISVPGLPGHRTVRATFTSPLDRYRGRA